MCDQGHEERFSDADGCLVCEVKRQRLRAEGSDAQLVWLAHWCRERYGVDSNGVIGREGWPATLVLVVAQVVERADAAKANVGPENGASD